MSEEVRNVNYVGIDIGSTASKVVVRGTSDMQFVLPTGWSSKETTQTIKEKLKALHPYQETALSDNVTIRLSDEVFEFHFM